MSDSNRAPADELPDEPASAVTRTGGKYLCGLLWCGLADSDRVATGDLAAKLDVSRASVTEMVEKFSDGGLVDHEHYRGSTLTADGEALARHLQWRRCVTQRFLESDLDLTVAPERAYDIGYELPTEGIDILAARLDHPCDDRCQATDAEECPRFTITSS